MPSISTNKYLAEATVESHKIDAWVEQFHRDGYLVLTDVLPPPVTATISTRRSRPTLRDPRAASSFTTACSRAAAPISVYSIWSP